MSAGAICECGHYKDHHNEVGLCLFEWHGKTCDCRQFRETISPTLKQFVEDRAMEADAQEEEAHHYRVDSPHR